MRTLDLRQDATDGLRALLQVGVTRRLRQSRATFP